MQFRGSDLSSVTLLSETFEIVTLPSDNASTEIRLSDNGSRQFDEKGKRVHEHHAHAGQPHR